MFSDLNFRSMKYINNNYYKNKLFLLKKIRLTAKEVHIFLRLAEAPAGYSELETADP